MLNEVKPHETASVFRSMEKRHYSKLSEYDSRLPDTPGTIYFYSNRHAWEKAFADHPPKALTMASRWLIVVED